MNDFFSKLLAKIPAWLGFLLMIIIGVVMLINGLANPSLDNPNQVGFIVFGICSVVIGVFSWIVGGTSEITGRTGKVGYQVALTDLPWWGWLVDIIVLIVSIILFVVLK